MLARNKHLLWSKIVFSLSVLTLLVLVGVVQSPQASAAALKLAPLEYRTTLGQGERKKGFIDVSNPSTAAVRVKTSVQAFRQTDDQGSLSFYDSEQLSAGVKLDLDEFDLGPREALRMYFELDSTKLPQGDVFGAVFFSTQPLKSQVGVGQAVRLGTILSIVNGTPGGRNAKVTSLDLPLFSLSRTVSGTYTIKNTGDPDKETGFYPSVTIDAKPFAGQRQEQGKLVFAGRSRENSFETKIPPIGIYKVSVAYGDSSQGRYVFVATPLAIIAVIAGIVFLVGFWKIYKRSQRRKSQANSTS